MLKFHNATYVETPINTTTTSTTTSATTPKTATTLSIYDTKCVDWFKTREKSRGTQKSKQINNITGMLKTAKKQQKKSEKERDFTFTPKIMRNDRNYLLSRQMNWKSKEKHLIFSTIYQYTYLLRFRCINDLPEIKKQQQQPTKSMNIFDDLSI